MFRFQSYQNYLFALIAWLGNICRTSFLNIYYILVLNIACRLHSFITYRTLWTHHQEHRRLWTHRHEQTYNQFSFSLSPQCLTQIIQRNASLPCQRTTNALVTGSIKCGHNFIFHLPL